MALPIVVPDASVILKWVLPQVDEPGSEQALLLRAAIAEERVRALVPSLWIYEVGNTLARRFPGQSARLLTALTKFSLEEAHPSGAWLVTALDLVHRFHCTFYDAAYHAVALVNKGQFITADSQYIKLAGRAGAVMDLRDWRPPVARRTR
jgi:predicted nucleic acid-binding protein